MKVRENGEVLVGLRLSTDLAEWCNKQAKQREISRNAWFTILLREQRERLEQNEQRQETA